MAIVVRINVFFSISAITDLVLYTQVKGKVKFELSVLQIWKKVHLISLLKSLKNTSQKKVTTNTSKKVQDMCFISLYY